MRRSTLTFFILSFIDGLVQLPITISSVSFLSRCHSLFLLFGFVYFISSSPLSSASIGFRGPARVQVLKSGLTFLGVPCWLLLVRQRWRPALILAKAILTDSSHQKIHSQDMSPNEGAQNQATWRNSNLNQFNRVSVHCRSITDSLLFTPINAFNPHLPSPCLSLPFLSRSHVASVFKWLHLQYEEF